jgi:hypothetical protein
MVRRVAKGIVMRLVAQGSNPLQTIFGGGYVIEQRGDDTQRNLPRPEDNEFGLDFGEILKALRTALSIRSLPSQL